MKLEKNSLSWRHKYLNSIKKYVKTIFNDVEVKYLFAINMIIQKILLMFCNID